MSTLTQFAHQPWVRTARTSLAVVAAGVLTGSVVYAVSIMVGTWN